MNVKALLEEAMTVFLTLFLCVSPNPCEHSRGAFRGRTSLVLEHNGVVRDFILYVPSQYDSATPTLFLQLSWLRWNI